MLAFADQIVFLVPLEQQLRQFLLLFVDGLHGMGSLGAFCIDETLEWGRYRVGRLSFHFGEKDGFCGPEVCLSVPINFDRVA